MFCFYVWYGHPREIHTLWMAMRNPEMVQPEWLGGFQAEVRQGKHLALGSPALPEIWGKNHQILAEMVRFEDHTSLSLSCHTDV